MSPEVQRRGAMFSGHLCIDDRKALIEGWSTG